MADIATSPPIYGDTENSLWLKIATAYWTQAGSPGSIQRPLYGDSTNTLILKTAQSIQSI